jgi:hypothetical protein
MDPPSSASSVDSAAGVDSSLLASRRQSHVPLACFGNGRRIEPPRNNKQPRKLADEVFVPSQALADIMQKIPEVRHERTREHAGRQPRASREIAGQPSHLSSFVFLLLFFLQASQARWSAALAQLGGSVLLVVLSVLLLAYSPWFFLPVAWIIAGASLSLMFIIGHDCAHKSGTHTATQRTRSSKRQREEKERKREGRVTRRQSLRRVHPLPWIGPILTFLFSVCLFLFIQQLGSLSDHQHVGR